MTIYDGSEFGAIDQVAYADGRPSDEWLRRKIENNVAFLTITEPPVTVMRRGGDIQSDAAGPYYADRAICSHQRTVFLAVPVWVTAVTSEIKIHVNFVTRAAFDVITPAVDLAVVGIAGGVRSVSGQLLGALDQAVYDKQGTYAAEGLTTFTIPVESGSEQWAIAYLTIISRTDDRKSATKGQAANSRSSGAVISRLNFDGAIGKYVPADNPDVDNDYCFDRAVIANELTGQYTDVLAFDKVSETAGTNIYEFIAGADVSPGIGLDMTYVGILPLSWMQMRSYTVEVVNRYNLREAELLSNLPERGIDSLRHGQSVISLRSRPRLVAAGPTGYMPAFRPAVQGRHPQIWQSAFGGDQDSAQPVTTLVRTGTTESLSDGIVRIALLLHGACHNAVGLGTVDWELVATVGNWIGTDTTVTQTFTVGTIGTQATWMLRAGGDGTEGKWIPSIQRAASNLMGFFTQYYAVRDGQFKEAEFADMTLAIIEVAMPATGGSVGLTVDVTAECVGNPQDLAIGNDPFEYQHLTCVAWSVYIVPEESA